MMETQQQVGKYYYYISSSCEFCLLFKTSWGKQLTLTLNFLHTDTKTNGWNVIFMPTVIIMEPKWQSKIPAE